MCSSMVRTETPQTHMFRKACCSNQREKRPPPCPEIDLSPITVTLGKQGIFQCHVETTKACLFFVRGIQGCHKVIQVLDTPRRVESWEEAAYSLAFRQRCFGHAGLRAQDYGISQHGFLLLQPLIQVLLRQALCGVPSCLAST